MTNYIPTIGLEIHAELKTKSKMFCSCFNDPAEHHPNVNICVICMGHPGTLPTANKEAIRMVQKAGLALNCEIAEDSKFDRKSYFYPDLPKGYQISQYDMPFCESGKLKIGDRYIPITRIHLEEDTAKSSHPEGTNYSLLDFNRAGVPLMELVTEPDITSATEAKQFAQELQLILRYIGISDAHMEKGQMRVEANVSVRPARLASESVAGRPEGTEKLGTKVEVKNLNSFRSVEKAIEYEIKRQTAALQQDEKIIQETRGWNDSKGETFVQREKESAHDYRYFPEPDIPPFHFSKAHIEVLRAELPELPQARSQRFKDEYKLTPKETDVFVQYKDIGEYFEKVVSELGPNIPREKLEKLIKLSANYILSDLMGLLESASIEDEDFLVTPENFAELILLIDQGQISSSIAKTILKEMFATGADPDHIIEDKGLRQVSNQDELTKIINEVLIANPNPVSDYKKGKRNALQFLAGQVMAKTKGKANPQVIQKLLSAALDKI